MIPAAKSTWFNRWFARHAERRLARSFAELCVHGSENVRALMQRGPVLVVANHTSWWDGLVLLYLTHRVLHADGYVLMDAQNLRRLSFFGRLGAFGVDVQCATDAAAGIRYASRLLDRPRRLVWIFPQGREVPVHVRPLGFRPGAAAVARLSPEAAVVPMGLRYEFGELERPRVYMSFGHPLPAVAEVERGRALQEAAVAEQLGHIERTIDAQDSEGHGFTSFLRHRPHWVSRLAVRWLACLARPSRRSSRRAGDVRRGRR